MEEKELLDTLEGRAAQSEEGADTKAADSDFKSKAAAELHSIQDTFHLYADTDSTAANSNVATLVQGMDAQKGTVRSKMQAVQAAEGTEVDDVITGNVPRMGEHMDRASKYG